MHQQQARYGQMRDASKVLQRALTRFVERKQHMRNALVSKSERERREWTAGI
jgi:hypothetical protein